MHTSQRHTEHILGEWESEEEEAIASQGEGAGLEEKNRKESRGAAEREGKGR